MSTNDRLAAIERTLRALGGNQALPGLPTCALEHIPSCRLQYHDWELMDYAALNQVLQFFPGLDDARYKPAPLSDGKFSFPAAVVKADTRVCDAFKRVAYLIRVVHTAAAKIRPDEDGRVPYEDFATTLEAILRLGFDSLQFMEKQRAEMLHAHYGTSASVPEPDEVAPIATASSIFDQLEERAALQQRAQALTGGGSGQKKNKPKNRKKKRAGNGGQEAATPAAQPAADPQGSDAQPRATNNSSGGNGSSGQAAGGNGGSRRNSTSRPNSSRRSSTHQ